MISWPAGKNSFNVSNLTLLFFCFEKVFDCWMFHTNVPRVGIDYNNRWIADNNSLLVTINLISEISKEKLANYLDEIQTRPNFFQ